VETRERRAPRRKLLATGALIFGLGTGCGVAYSHLVVKGWFDDLARQVNERTLAIPDLVVAVESVRAEQAASRDAMRFLDSLRRVVIARQDSARSDSARGS